MTTPTEPTVKLTPDFKAGETVIHLGEKTEHKIVKVHPDKTLTLAGLAGRIRPDAVQKK